MEEKKRDYDENDYFDRWRRVGIAGAILYIFFVLPFFITWILSIVFISDFEFRKIVVRVFAILFAGIGTLFYSIT